MLVLCRGFLSGRLVWSELGDLGLAGTFITGEVAPNRVG